jgi:hypothetical protein
MISVIRIAHRRETIETPGAGTKQVQQIRRRQDDSGALVATNFSEPHRVCIEAIESAFGMEIFVTVGDDWTWGAATT